MPVFQLEPSDDIPIPYDMSPETGETFIDNLGVAANTAELLHDMGAPIEVSATDFAAEKRLIDAVVHKKKEAPLRQLPVALGAAAFLRQYGQSVALDAAQVRVALTQKLLEIANCGETKYELKAIELLGKHSDVGLFTERSEININYKNADNLEAAIKERVKRLLNADVVDIKPLSLDLEEELGVYDADFEEVVYGGPKPPEFEWPTGEDPEIAAAAREATPAGYDDGEPGDA